METHRQDESALTSAESRSRFNKAIQAFIWIVFPSLLLFVGLIIELGPKWSSGLIHIPLAPRHGFTDQDAVALIPISLAIALYGIAIRKYRIRLQYYVHRYPERSFLIALMIGLSLGLMIGIIVGAIFETYIAYVYQLFRRLI